MFYATTFISALQVIGYDIIIVCVDMQPCIHDLAYGFSVDGVHSKEESCYQSWPHLTENHTTQLDIQVAHCTMQEYIHQIGAGLGPL